MNKVLEVILKLTDQFTAPLQKSEGGLKSFGSSMANMIGGAVTLGGIAMAIRKAWEAADEYRVALQKLEGTAKITGVALDFLQGIARDAGERFGLSKSQAADFAVEMAKLATKAGDVSKAGPGLQAFLDIGAARGLTAAETLKAVQQAILGIDEGTDKLFNANPSVLYAEFAEKIGTTAGKLTDQQKAQALLNAAMEDGSKVTGEYGKWLGTVAGQAQLAKNRSDEAWASFGMALDGMRTALSGAIAWIASGLTAFVGGIQLIGNDIGYFFARIPAEIELMWRALMVAVAWGVEKLGSLIPFVGDKLEEAGRRMGASQKAQGQQTLAYLNALREGHEQAAFDIVGIATEGQKGQTNALRTGGQERARLAESQNTAAEKREKDAADALLKLKREAMVGGMTSLGLELFKLQELLDEALKTANATAHAEAIAAWKERVAQILIAAAELDKMVPQMQDTTDEMLEITYDWGEETEEVVKTTAQKWDEYLAAVSKVAGEVEHAADVILQFAHDAGIADEQVTNLVGGVANLADGLKQITGATSFEGLLGGIGVLVGGLQGVMGALFGDSPAEQARKALLAENSRRLRELRDSIGNLLEATLPGAKVAGFKAAAGGMEVLTGGGNSNLDVRQRFVAFVKYLASQGLSITDAGTVATDIGLGDLFGDGQLSKEEVAQFIEGLKLWESNRVGQDFESQQEFQQRHFNVAGIDDPIMQAEFAKNNLKGKNDFLFDMISGFNLSTAEGRSGLNEKLIQVLNDLNNGLLGDAVFQGLTGGQFIDFVEFFSDLITSGVVPAPSGGTIGDTFNASKIGGVEFVGESIDIKADIVGPLFSIDEKVGRMLDLFASGAAGGITIQQLNVTAGTPAAAATDFVTALDEEMRLARDRSALLRGE